MHDMTCTSVPAMTCLVHVSQGPSLPKTIVPAAPPFSRSSLLCSSVLVSVISEGPVEILSAERIRHAAQSTPTLTFSRFCNSRTPFLSSFLAKFPRHNTGTWWRGDKEQCLLMPLLVSNLQEFPQTRCGEAILAE